MTDAADPLDVMSTFLRVVRLGSLTRAARDLGVAPSSVSRRIAALEKRLQVTLIERSTRRLTLTAAGRLYADRAAGILDAMQQLDLTMAAFVGRPRGRLRVTAPIAFAERHVVAMLPDFLRANPDVDVDLRLSNARLDLVGEDIDIAIRLGPLPESRLIAARIAPLNRVLCASPDYLAAAGAPAGPDDLAAHTFLAFRRPSGPRQWQLASPDGTVVDVRIPVRLTADTSEAIRQAALRHMGLTILPTWLVGEDLAAGRLRRVLPDWPVRSEASEAIHAVYAPGRRTSPNVKAFVAAFKAWAGQPARWDVG